MDPGDRVVPQDLTSLREHRQKQLRFAVVFVVAAGALLALYGFPYAPGSPMERFFQSYLRAYARLAGRFLVLFDSGVRVSGNLIAGRFSMAIVRTCDAMEANVLFVAAILAFPAPWARKAIAAALGLSVLVLTNLIRICSLYFVGVYAPAAFDPVHIEVWPLLLIVLALANFLGWATWMTRSRRPLPIS